MPAGSRLRRGARRAGALAVALGIGLATGELLALGYLTLRDGFAWPGERLDAQRNAYTEATRRGECSYGDSLLVHPYLAFVQTGLGPCGAAYANARGLIGRPFPDRVAEDTGVILVTGGSVAAQFTWDNRERPSPLEEILNREFTGARFRRFIVLNGGHGAWKQPNQYVLFGLYAGVLDGVITLDGFNEHYMLEASSRFELPARNFFQAVERQDRRMASAPYSMAALKLEAELFRESRESGLVRSSHLAYLLVDRARALLRGYASQRDTEEGGTLGDAWLRDSYERMFALDGALDSDAERLRHHLRQYRKYVRLMHAGAEAYGIPSLFLIQPTPAFRKPLTPEEEAFADGTRRERYRALVEALVGLRRSRGLPVHSLLGAFAGVEETIYTDYVHVNERGNRILAERVAGLIESEWGWRRRSASTAGDGSAPSGREAAE